MPSLFTAATPAVLDLSAQVSTVTVSSFLFAPLPNSGCCTPKAREGFHHHGPSSAGEDQILSLLLLNEIHPAPTHIKWVYGMLCSPSSSENRSSNSADRQNWVRWKDKTYASLVTQLQTWTRTW